MDETFKIQQDETPHKSHANRYFIILMLVIPVLVLPLVFAVLILLPSNRSAYTKFYTDKDKTNFIEIPAGWTLEYSNVATKSLRGVQSGVNELTVNYEIKLLHEKLDYITLSQSVMSTFTAQPTESCYSPSSSAVIIKEPESVEKIGAIRRQIGGQYSYSLLFAGCSDGSGAKYHLTGGGDGVVAPYFIYEGNNPKDADDIFIRNFTRSNPVQLFSSIKS